MTHKHYELLLAAVTLAFLCFTAGYVIGRANRGDPVIISTQYSSPSPSPSLYSAPASEKSVPENDRSEKDGPVNINTADVHELADLPGVGEVLAERIAAYREKHGAFVTIYDITAVSGIGDGKFETIKDLITVGENTE